MSTGAVLRQLSARLGQRFFESMSEDWDVFLSELEGVDVEFVWLGALAKCYEWASF